MPTLYTTEFPDGRRFAIRRIVLPDDLTQIWVWWTAPHVLGRWSMRPRLGDPDPVTGEHSVDQLRVYLEKLQRDDGRDGRALPVIGAIDGVDACYVEVYGVGSSPLADHPELQPEDRGLHLIIGNPSFLGQGGRLGAAITAWQFAAYPKARRVAVEPDARNVRAIRAARAAVGDALEERGNIELPHKVAALLTVERSAFAAFVASGRRRSLR